MMSTHTVTSIPEPAPPPRRRSRLGTAAGAAILALMALAGWWLLRPAAPPSPLTTQEGGSNDTVTLAEGAPQWAYLELAVAEAKPAITPSPAPGRVAFDEKRSAAVTSPLPGRVDEVRVRLGDQVKAGDRLVAVRSGALADLDRELESARSQVAAKTRVAERARELVGLRAAPEKDLLEAEEDLREAQLALKAAIAKRDSLNASIDGDTRFWITARQDGTVVEFDVATGQQVGPDREHPLLRLSNIDRVLVLTDLQEQDAYDVRVGEPATVRTASGDVTRPGVVEYVSQVVDPQRRTVELRVRVENADHELRPNAFVEVALTPDSTQRRVRVPDEAVVSDGEQSVVFVTREAGRLERTPVTVGRRGDGEVEVRSGLEPGTRYVAKGALLILNQLQLAQ
jgi:cobalt-zinc-cadmium efflux system membrane fusion protein